MNTSTLVAAVSAETGRPVHQIKSVIRAAINKIRAEIASGEHVELHGLGTFRAIKTKPKKGRDWSTGQPIDIPAGRKVKFTPVAALLKPEPEREPVEPRAKRDGLDWTRGA